MAVAQDKKKGWYDYTVMEARWQRYWADNQTFRAPNPGEPGFDPKKPKYYVLDMFPYPSGSGLHVGHPVGYCATDIIARYKRMCGYNVLHPMGFDAFGLPAEQYAIEHNVHPRVTTRKNIDRYREQLQMFGFSYDWSRELATCDATYYKFTQWIFLCLFRSWYDPTCRWVDSEGNETLGRARPISELTAELEAGRWGVSPSGTLEREPDAEARRIWADMPADQQRTFLDAQRLARVDGVPVNWCPALGTVLANEEVTNEGRSDRGDHPVYRRPLRQWMLRITCYADRLLSDLDGLDWPEPIKLMQRNWIGRSTGAEIAFPLERSWRVDTGAWVSRTEDIDAARPLSYESFPHAIRVYTTRPDTLFGATYMVLAPEHELVEEIITDERRAEVEAYASAARHRSDMDRTADTKEKTGVFTGAFAINPVTGNPIPIWVADYVLVTYGTGAIMAVPGGDTRDFEFACKFDLPIVAVVTPPACWMEERIDEMASRVEPSAAAGFDQLAKELPELADEIAERRKRCTGLSDKTRRMLLEQAGTERLLAHYLAHPKSWGVAYVGEGASVHSPGVDGHADVPGGVCTLNGLSTPEAKQRIVRWLADNGVGRAAVNYKLRDWIFSRQKYWGEPFPVLHGQDGETVGLSDADLPVALPEVEDFKPTPAAGDAESLPEPPLGRAKEWVAVEQDGKSYRRDLNTMPQWAGSCWYYLRFIDPKNELRFCDKAAEDYWMPIDLYVGGAEHAVLHLLYARFWHKVLFDLGHVSTREPFHKLFNQGMIQGFAFRDGAGRTLGGDAVKEIGDDRFVTRETGEPVTRVIAKMSKSLKNVVNPDEIIAANGADTFRLYEMFMGPLDAAKPWNTRDVPGLFKLCRRIWRLVVDEETGACSSRLTDDEPDEAALRALHKLIKRVTGDIEQLKLNTAIAAIFDFVNFMTPRDRRPRAVIESFILVVAPFAPHLAEELWHRLGHDNTLAYEAWPPFDDALTRDLEVEVGVQINGKVRARVMVSADATEEAIQTAALGEDRIVEALLGKTVRKVIVVKGRLVNIVVT